MSFQPGDVVRLWDRLTKPPKPKLHICIWPEKQLFLRINSRPLFRPHHPLAADANTFLEHDSFVELRQLCRHYASDIRGGLLVGKLGRTQIVRLVSAIRDAPTLTQDEKDAVCDRLMAVHS